MTRITCPVTVLPHGDGLSLPSYATDGAAGMDAIAAVEETLTLGPGERVAVPTGLSVAIPEGHEIQIRPRSGLAFRHGLTVANAPGTIDSDYRGEIKILLINLGQDEVEISRGMRIAQMVFAPVTRADWSVVDALPETARGDGGFGSTGTST